MVFVHGETGFCVHTHLLVLPAPSWISKSIHKSFTSLAGCAARRVGSPLFTAYPSRKNGNGRSVRHLPHVTAATGGKMSSTAVTKKGQQDVSSTGQQPMMESREQSASASASVRSPSASCRASAVDQISDLRSFPPAPLRSALLRSPPPPSLHIPSPSPSLLDLTARARPV